MNDDAAILTTSLTKRYGERAAVQDLSIEVGPGEIYAFLGLNGAGKTTTIRMLLGMIHPTSGESRVLGRKIVPGITGVWADVGYLVETPHAYPELTVRENLEAFRWLRRIDDPLVVDRMVERLGLADYADQVARTLSLGNAQRLGLAKAMMHEPRLLLLDEPANGLDPAGVVEIRDLLQELAREKAVTVFLSSHILGEVARLATRIGIIHRGRLIQEANAGELFEHVRRWLVVDTCDRAATRKVLTSAGYAWSEGTDGFKLTAQEAVRKPETISALLAQAGLPPTHLVSQREDLESYFLRLVGAEVSETR